MDNGNVDLGILAEQLINTWQASRRQLAEDDKILQGRVEGVTIFIRELKVEIQKVQEASRQPEVKEDGGETE